VAARGKTVSGARLKGPRVFDAESFAAILRIKVEHSGLSDAGVARESGVATSTLCQAMQAKRGNPSLETFARLCRWMRMPIGLFFREGEQP
jgi:transcriptional regulator with XRE-family HTH domain